MTGSDGRGQSCPSSVIVHNFKEGPIADSISEIIRRLGMSEGDFRQDSVVELIENPMSGTWSVVYDTTGAPMKSTHIFSCFARSELREEIMSGQDWLRHADSFCPGFCMGPGDVVYESGLEGGFEYIVASTYFHSLETSQLHLNMEFVLLFNLFRSEDGDYYAVDECGEKSPVVLDKYRKGSPYTVTEYRLSCGSQWGVEIDFGLESVTMLEEIISLLEAEGIELPDARPVELMRFEGDGRGEPYDAKPLSRIL